jgi:hypothetical protein
MAVPFRARYQSIASDLETAKKQAVLCHPAARFVVCPCSTH